MDYLKNYIEVKDRIQMFYDKYPNGVLRFQYRGVLEFNGETFIYGEAFAYPERRYWMGFRGRSIGPLHLTELYKNYLLSTN